MRSLLARIVLALLAVGGVTAVFLVPFHPFTTTSSAGSPPATLYLDMPSPGIVPGQGWPVPPNCTYWHELYPHYCNSWHQQAYYDSFPTNGLLDPCDNIVLTDQKTGVTSEFHIDAVVPTYYLTCYPPGGGTPTQLVAEPAQLVPGSSPVCEIWHEVWPNFCNSFHIDSWNDANANGILDECDYVDVETPTGTFLYHIDRIGCDIIVSEKVVTGTKRSTWGWIKSLFRK